MYVGMTLVVVGSGLLSGRPWTALAAGGLMATLTPQVEREEAALARLFGEEWTAYSSRVRRWV
jgi:protein-S-isoprenylcysteine O-methyltransferase Ste14